MFVLFCYFYIVMMAANVLHGVVLELRDIAMKNELFQFLIDAFFCWLHIDYRAEFSLVDDFVLLFL